MRRDMELVRKILIDTMNDDVKNVYKDEDEQDKSILYHLDIMKQAGLIDFKKDGDWSKNTYIEDLKLTWNGNEYLDALQNDNVWEKTKTHIKQKGFELGEVTFDFLKELAIQQARKLIGLD